ncbi:MAG: PGPGW domain-containing protein [Gammaproteobacteria bacterium]|nr:PGPGW domain-containing protein [Gammaproteobacteria bacterium]
MIIELLHNYKNELFIFAWLSVVLLIVSIAIIPWVVIKIPDDYFHEHYRVRVSKSSGHPLIAQLLAGLKNLVGFIFVIFGILMLILPGQGILTILIGLFLMNFPGKYQFERKIVSLPRVLKSLNWIRAKANKPPLMVE